MKASHYRIVPLPTEVAATARRAAEAGAADHAVITVKSPNEAPCRHCLGWAQPGEKVVLFPYASIAPGRPYAESGPIFIHAAACQRYTATNEFPAAFRRGRVIRAYDAEQNMIAGEAVGANEPETIIEKLLENPDTAFLQARSVTRGCYTFRIERV